MSMPADAEPRGCSGAGSVGLRRGTAQRRRPTEVGSRPPAGKGKEVEGGKAWSCSPATAAPTCTCSCRASLSPVTRCGPPESGVGGVPVSLGGGWSPPDTGTFRRRRVSPLLCPPAFVPQRLSAILPAPGVRGPRGCSFSRGRACSRLAGMDGRCRFCGGYFAFSGFWFYFVGVFFGGGCWGEDASGDETDDTRLSPSPPMGKPCWKG